MYETANTIYCNNIGFLVMSTSSVNIALYYIHMIYLPLLYHMYRIYIVLCWVGAREGLDTRPPLLCFILPPNVV